MSIVLLFVLMFLVFSLEVSPTGKFQSGYLSRESTANIKGIFVLLIFFSHYAQYVSLDGRYDDAYLILRNHMKQMVVVMFWFYSGYGMMKSIITKGRSYIHPGLLKRFGKVWVQFAAAVTLFLITGLALGKNFQAAHVIRSYIGWDSIGNSNWYIFDTLAAYLLLYAAFLLAGVIKRKSAAEYAGCILFTVGILVFVYLLMLQGRSGYWYNTIFILPMGCWYALLQSKVESWVMKNRYSYLLVIILMMVLYFAGYQNRWDGIEQYTLWACAFTGITVLLTMKCRVNSPVFLWLGQHVFSVYILQRIPMMVLDRMGLAENHKYVFLIMSLLITMLLAMLFDDTMEKILQRRLGFRRKN